MRPDQTHAKAVWLLATEIVRWESILLLLHFKICVLRANLCGGDQRLRYESRVGIAATSITIDILPNVVSGFTQVWRRETYLCILLRPSVPRGRYSIQAQAFFPDGD